MVEIRHGETRKVLYRAVSQTLVSARLRELDFRGAELRGADLRRADLCRADLTGADLQGAAMSGVAGSEPSAVIRTVAGCLGLPVALIERRHSSCLSLWPSVPFVTPCFSLNWNRTCQPVAGR